MNSKTFYVWDQADTLFAEVWDIEKTGLPDYNVYVLSLGHDIETMPKRVYENAYEIPYRTEMFKVELMPGFKELLSWTKHNAAFTTGVPEQREWRTDQIKRKYGIELKDYIPEVFSTFDYGNTNVKTVEMYADVVRKVQKRGFTTVVYADDKIANCEMFEAGARTIPGITYRLYRVNPAMDSQLQGDTIKEVKNLFDILESEKNLVNSMPRIHYH